MVAKESRFQLEREGNLYILKDGIFEILSAVIKNLLITSIVEISSISNLDIRGFQHIQMARVGKLGF